MGCAPVCVDTLHEHVSDDVCCVLVCTGLNRIKLSCLQVNEMECSDLCETLSLQVGATAIFSTSIHQRQATVPYPEASTHRLREGDVESVEVL